MAVTDVTAIKYCNERARVYADLKAQLIYFAQICDDEFTAKGMNTLIPAGGGVIGDTASTEPDGRTVITADDVRTLRQRMLEDIAVGDSLAQMNNVLKVAVNPER